MQQGSSIIESDQKRQLLHIPPMLATKVDENGVTAIKIAKQNSGCIEAKWVRTKINRERSQSLCLRLCHDLICWRQHFLCASLPNIFGASKIMMNPFSRRNMPLASNCIQLSEAARHDQNFIHYVSQVVQACSSMFHHSMVLIPCAEESFPGCCSAFTQCRCERNARRAGCVLDWTTR